MRRKNLIARRKVRFHSEENKIKEFYKKFEKVIFNNVKNNNFAVAVSGGADSLSLAYFSKIYNSKFKNKVFYLIVNHKLRKESGKEAIKVKNILKKKGIQSQILNWTGKIPLKNIQGNARNIRYNLMSDYCVKKNIKYLITGHHLDDQIENFFIRLFRGSGLTGLSSMQEIVDYNSNLKIVRPFLKLEKKHLKYVTTAYFKTYIKDPSNKNEKFLRVRVRRYRKEMEKEGLDTSKIIKTVNNLLSANKAINFYKNKALFKHASFLSERECLINSQIFSEEANEVIFKSFSDILSLVSGKYYPPRSKKVINLINRVKRNQFKKSTLGGCVIDRKDNLISIVKERNSRSQSLRLHK